MKSSKSASLFFTCLGNLLLDMLKLSVASILIIGYTIRMGVVFLFALYHLLSWFVVSRSPLSWIARAVIVASLMYYNISVNTLAL